MYVKRIAHVAALVAMVLVALVALESPAYADSIGPNCGSCQGSIYTLQYNPTPVATGTILVQQGNHFVSVNTQTFEITYTIDTSGYNGGGTHIDNVGFHVTGGTSLFGASLVSAPGGTGDWVVSFNSTVDANGCSANGGGGWTCADLTLSGAAADAVTGVPNATPYVWVFDVQIQQGTLLTGADAASIKARYVDDAGTKVGDLVSESITLQKIPEPASMVLFGSGLVGLAGVIRRRLQR